MEFRPLITLERAAEQADGQLEGEPGLGKPKKRVFAERVLV